MRISDGGSYDIIVCGCGSAGFCAAVQAARISKRVAVIEKYAMPGGVLTVLGNNSVDQFNNPFISGPNRVIGGIGWEFVTRLEKMGYAHIPDMRAEYENHAQYGVKVNPVAAAKLMDDMLAEAGVDIFYDQQAVWVETSAEQNKTRLDAVIIATKSGLRRLKASVFIDCTGDGTVSVWAGAGCEEGDGKGNMQPGTLRFYPGGAVSEVSEQWKYLLESRGDNCNHITKFNPIDSKKQTEGEIRGRKTVFNLMEELRRGKQPIDIVSAAPAVAPRESRRIECDSRMLFADYGSGALFPDSICYSFWFLDIHRDEGESHIEYLTDGQTPAIRLSAMLPKRLSNVLVAGRCVCSDRETNSALRVKASCMAMGQAAGMTAGLACEKKASLREVPVNEIKSRLDEAGAVVPGLSPFKEFSC